jgi:flagellar FliL protein
MSAPTKTRDKEKDKEKEKPEGEGEAKGSRKKLLVIVAVVVLALGAGAYFFLFSGSGGPEPAPKPGVVEALDPVAVNLAGGGYLKVGIALQLTEDAGETKPDGSKAIDLVISTFSQAQPADVVGARDALKAALQKKIIAAYGEDVVMGIYYNNYVTQ